MGSKIKSEEIITDVISSPSIIIKIKNRVKGVAAVDPDEYVLLSQLSGLENSIAYVDGNNVFTSYNEFQEPVIGVPATNGDEFPVLSQVKDLLKSGDPLIITPAMQVDGKYTLAWSAALKEKFGKYGRFNVEVLNTYQQTSIEINKDVSGAPTAYIFDLSGLESYIHIF